MNIGGKYSSTHLERANSATFYASFWGCKNFGKQVADKPLQ